MWDHDDDADAGPDRIHKRKKKASQPELSFGGRTEVVGRREVDTFK